jgi:hypothetical protein
LLTWLASSQDFETIILNKSPYLHRRGPLLRLTCPTPLYKVPIIISHPWLCRSPRLYTFNKFEDDPHIQFDVVIRHLSREHL